MIHTRLNMIPGPTPVHDSILGALGRPTPSHLDPDFLATFKESLLDLRRIVRSERAQPFIVAGAGTLAMEMALVNLLGPGQRLLVVSHGYFGDRFGEIAEAFGIECELLQSTWGEAIPPEQLAATLDAGRFSAVCLTHVDTSTGVAAPIEAYAGLLRDRDELLILDGVCATAGMDERFDDWGVDVLLTGAQKALGAPPGVAILAVSPRAMERRRQRESCGAYYADLLRWLPIMEDPGRYFSTPAVNEIAALGQGLRLILDEGLDRRFARHRRLAASVRAGSAALGFESFAAPDCLAPTLSVLRYPEGIDDGAFRSGLASRGVIVAGALGPVAGRACRIGHMGNIGHEEIARLLDAMERTLVEMGRDVEPGTALAAAANALGG